MTQQSQIEDRLFLKPVGRWPLTILIVAAIGTSAVGAYQFYQYRKVEETVPPPAVAAPVKTAVTALGRLEPEGEIIKVSAGTSTMGTALVSKLLVKQGDTVQVGQEIAILDSRDRLQAALDEAKQQVEVAQAQLAKVKAGAKEGEIAAQKAEIGRLQAQLDGEKKTQVAIAARLQAQLLGERNTQRATIARLQAQLDGERRTQQAIVARLQAQLEGERRTQQATIARLQAQMRNAQVEFERYQGLFRQGALEASKFDTKRLELETATEQLNEARASLSRTEATLGREIDEAEANLRKTEQTLQQQINEAQSTRSQTEETLQQQVNEALATRNQTVETLQQQILQAKETLNKIAEVRPIDVQASMVEIEKAKAGVRKAQAELNTAYVRSPVVGQVLKINTRAGETVSNNGIVEIGQTTNMYVVAEVYQTEIEQVRLGQKATVYGTAFNGKLKGSVDQIGLKIGKKSILNDDPAADQDARVVEVKIRLAPEDSKKVAGLTNLQVEVAIDISGSNLANTTETTQPEKQ